MTKDFTLDGKKYSADILSESGKQILSGLEAIEIEIKEKTNFLKLEEKKAL